LSCARWNADIFALSKKPIMRNAFYFLFFFLTYTFISCDQGESSGNVSTPAAGVQTGSLVAKDTTAHKPGRQWEKYWYAGTAEITSYHLLQSRYGELHEGSVVNVFVTEDFSRTKQVKLDEPEEAGSDRVKILKLNQAFKFVTGIYPYSMMLSTFSPIDINRYPHAIKVTASAQEWCGQGYFQLNNRNNRFVIEQRSYFEKEGDQNLALEEAILEDELWNLARIDPEKLPTGERPVLPGALYFRLSHKPIQADTARLSLTEKDSSFIYTVSYPRLNRTLGLTINKSFPYAIESWSDTFPGTDGKPLTTTATRNRMMLVDYWEKHFNKDRVLREALGLSPGLQ
jgi:hypothetical protein